MGSNQRLVVIDADLCIGAGECVATLPDAFALDDGDLVARVLPGARFVSDGELQHAMDQCPTGAISVR